MKIVECTRCGSTELFQYEGFAQCAYCQSKFAYEADDLAAKNTTIGLSSDIEQLLQKCKDDPANRRRYAGLILDIDPTNPQAIQYLK